nr:fumarate hydratase 1, mitochondrial-like [Tanacetum cinerariifolium]
IMPGKRNPTLAEVLVQAAMQVMGNHTTITLAGASSVFELNVAKPVLIHNLLQSIGVLAHSVRIFTEKLLRGLEINRQQLNDNLENALLMATVLNPVLGYDRVAQITRKALQEALSPKSAAVALGFITPEEYERCAEVTGPAQWRPRHLRALGTAYELTLVRLDCAPSELPPKRRTLKPEITPITGARIRHEHHGHSIRIAAGQGQAVRNRPPCASRPVAVGAVSYVAGVRAGYHLVARRTGGHAGRVGVRRVERKSGVAIDQCRYRSGGRCLHHRCRAWRVVFRVADRPAGAAQVVLHHFGAVHQRDGRHGVFVQPVELHVVSLSHRHGHRRRVHGDQFDDSGIHPGAFSRLGRSD